MLSRRTFGFLFKKIAFRRIQEKNRDSRKPRSPRITSRWKQGKARACDWGCTARENHSSWPAKWHGQAVPGSTTVPLCTVWPCFLAQLCHDGARRGLKAFSNFLSGIFFIFSSFVFLAFRERLERVFEGLIRPLDLELFELYLGRFEVCSTLKH